MLVFLITFLISSWIIGMVLDVCFPEEHIFYSDYIGLIDEDTINEKSSN